MGIEKKMAESKTWAMATDAINGIVDQANEEGRMLTESEREALAKVRILATMLGEPDIMREVSDDIWHRING